MLRDAERAFVSAGLSDKLSRKGEGRRHHRSRARGGAAASSPSSRRAARRRKSRTARGILKAAIDAISGAATCSPATTSSIPRLEALGAYAEARQTSEAVEVVARRATQLRETSPPSSTGPTTKSPGPKCERARPRSEHRPSSSPARFKGGSSRRSRRWCSPARRSPPTTASRFLRSRLGLEGDDIPVEELEVPSPFDYPTRALVYVPRDLPDPSDPAWLDAAAPRIAELVEASGRRRVHSGNLEARHAGAARVARRGVRGRPVFVQGEAPKGVAARQVPRARRTRSSSPP